MRLAVEPSLGPERKVREMPISLGLLRSIAAYEAAHRSGPTLDQLAGDVGIPADFADFLASPLSRELSQGRVAVSGGRYRLTAAGRARLDGAAVGSGA